MKKFIIVLLLFLAKPSLGQTLEQLKLDAFNLYKASFEMNFEKVLNYSHPKIFEVTTKEEMIKIFKTTFDNAEMKIRFVTVNPTFNYSKIQKIENTTFCVIKYVNSLKMTFVKKISDDQLLDMNKAFQASKQYKVINFEKENNSFLIESNSIMIAVNNEETNYNWKFINHDQSNQAITEYILGKEVVVKLIP